MKTYLYLIVNEKIDYNIMDGIEMAKSLNLDIIAYLSSTKDILDLDKTLKTIVQNKEINIETCIKDVANHHGYKIGITEQNKRFDLMYPDMISLTEYITINDQVKEYDPKDFEEPKITYTGRTREYKKSR